MSTLLSWLIAGIKLVIQVIVITWTTLAIYFSNLPWPALRLGLSVAFAAFAIWAFWVSRQRRMPAVAIALVLGVVAWWLTITPSGDQNWRPEVAVMPRALKAVDATADHYEAQSSNHIREDDGNYVNSSI
jgi:hypothetical protein